MTDPGKCEHGRGLTDYCEPCGRTHSAPPDTHTKCTAGSSGGDVLVTLADGRQKGVDPCIAELVQALNDAGFPTHASCCGHGHRPGNIALVDGRELFVAGSYEEARGLDAFIGVDIHGERRGDADWEWLREYLRDGAPEKVHASTVLRKMDRRKGIDPDNPGTNRGDDMEQTTNREEWLIQAAAGELRGDEYDRIKALAFDAVPPDEPEIPE